VSGILLQVVSWKRYSITDVVGALSGNYGEQGRTRSDSERPPSVLGGPGSVERTGWMSSRIPKVQTQTETY
jgi:hypothetical protein